jgi:hypothetical protein
MIHDHDESFAKSRQKFRHIGTLAPTLEYLAGGKNAVMLRRG